MDGRLAKGQSTRDHLVTAAQILFARDGYDATSTETILQQSDVSRGSLYHHFPDKKALFDQLVGHATGDFEWTKHFSSLQSLIQLTATESGETDLLNAAIARGSPA